jgi:hypothetical protein
MSANGFLLRLKKLLADTAANVVIIGTAIGSEPVSFRCQTGDFGDFRPPPGAVIGRSKKISIIHTNTTRKGADMEQGTATATAKPLSLVTSDQPQKPFKVTLQGELPPDQLAHLVNPASAPPQFNPVVDDDDDDFEFEDYDEDEEEDEEPQPLSLDEARKAMRALMNLYPEEFIAAPLTTTAEAGRTERAEPDEVQQYIAEAERDEVLMMYPYQLPPHVDVNSLPGRLPKERIGWKVFTPMSFNPVSYENDIVANCPPGNYWLDVRDNKGHFIKRHIVSVGGTQAMQPYAPYPMPPLQAEPTKPAAEMQLSQLVKLHRELVGTLAPPPTASVPKSLIEQLTELKQVEKVLGLTKESKPRPTMIEEFQELVRSDVLKSLKQALKSENAAPTSNWVDSLIELGKEALPIVLEMAAPLVQELSISAATNIRRNRINAERQAAAQAQPIVRTQPRNPVRPTPVIPAAQPLTNPMPPASEQPNQLPMTAPQPIETEMIEEEFDEVEETSSPLELFMEALAEQRDTEETARVLLEFVREEPEMQTQLSGLLAMPNAVVWQMLVVAGANKQQLDSFTWRNDWMKKLKAAVKNLQKGDKADDSATVQ